MAAERMPAPMSAESIAALRLPCTHCGRGPLDWCFSDKGRPTVRLHRARFVASGWCT